MKTKIELPQIIGAISKSQSCIIIFEALQHNGSDLIAQRCYEISEDKMHLLKDEIILQRHQAASAIEFLLEADSLLYLYLLSLSLQRLLLFLTCAISFRIEICRKASNNRLF